MQPIYCPYYVKFLLGLPSQYQTKIKELLEQKIGLTAAEAEMSHQDRMRELALKGKTTGALDVQKKARIIWNNNKGPTNPNGNVNPITKEPWKSYEFD